MKKIIYIAFALLVATNCSAQIESAAKSVFSLTTFKKDGTLLASTHGVFVGDKGEAISSWKPFVGADSAVVIDAKGKQSVVSALIGANELYNVCKFKVDGNTQPASVATAASKKGEKVWILQYSVNKPLIDQRNVQSVEPFMEKYAYYLFSSNIDESADGCPVVNSKGQVIGVIQISKDGQQIVATDANFMNDMTVENGLAIANPVLRQSFIPIDFPKNHEQAAVMLTLTAEQRDTLMYNKYVKAFIQRFPGYVEGYNALANRQLAKADFSGVDTTIKTALEKVAKKEDVHSAYSRLIYNKVSNLPDSIYPSWNADKALEEANKAYDIDHQPLYVHQQALAYFVKKDYVTAYDKFMELTKTPIRNGDLFYSAAQCKTQMKAPDAEIVALLDSAIAVSPQPLNFVGAPYVLARATHYYNIGEYRKAVIDFNQYDSLMQGRPITSNFYYIRHKAEMEIHQYQQALNDMDRAILLQRDSPTLWAEKASLHLRFSQTDKAIRSAEICTQLAPEYADGYILLGVANMVAKNKEEGTKALMKAKELGDERADEYLKKYK